MYVRAVLEEGVIDQAIQVPQRGVTRDATGNATAMVVVGAGEKVAQRALPSTLHRRSRLVSQGLNPGDRVIVEGAAESPPRGHREGRPVRRPAGPDIPRGRRRARRGQK